MVNEYVWTQKHSVTDLKVGKALSKGGSKWESLGNLRFAQGNHSIRSWFTSRSGHQATWRVSTVHGLVKGFPDHPTWGLYFTFQQLAFRWGEWKIKFVSPVLGIDGKNPKSRTVPPGFRSSCGQEPASSMGQTAKITAVLTLEDQSGLFQTQGTETR